MKKLLIIIYMLLLLASLGAQDSQTMVDTFIANFSRASLEVKLQVLQDAVEMGIAGMGPLYQEAIDFVLNNAASMDTVSTYREISSFSIIQIKTLKYKNAKNSLWNLFLLEKDARNKVNIMNTLGDIAVNDTKIIDYMNKWLDSQNSTFKSGQIPDLQVVDACVEALGKLADYRSFPIIFTTYISGFTDVITQKASVALDQISKPSTTSGGMDAKQLYTGIIRNGAFIEKNKALERVLNSTIFTDTDKSEIAEYALNISLHSSVNDVQEQINARKTRYMAIDFIGTKQWSNATELVIEHFNRTIVEMDRAVVGKEALIQAISALGNMLNHESAKRLTLHLDHINSFTEHGRTYDEQIVLSIIASLKKLGDMVANGTLLYTKYLTYSDTVKKAAMDAIKSLK